MRIKYRRVEKGHYYAEIDGEVCCAIQYDYWNDTVKDMFKKSWGLFVDSNQSMPPDYGKDQFDKLLGKFPTLREAKAHFEEWRSKKHG